MFDIIHTTPNTINVHKHEHRAPTDESIRLYKELEEKALQRLISTTTLEDNTFNATWHVFTDFINHENKAICRYKLNGVEYQFEADVDSIHTGEKLAKEMLKKIREKIADHLFISLAGMTEFRKMVR